MEDLESEPLSEIEQLRKDKAQLEMDVAHLLRHDQLTGLLNRSAFVAQVDKILCEMDHNSQKGAMIEIGVRGLPRGDRSGGICPGEL